MNFEGGVRSFDSFATSLPKGERRNPITHTQSPVTTGTSIIAFEYDGGIMMAADMLGSYGSLARYRSVPRLLKINDNTVIGCMGDYADFQYLQAIIEQMEVDEACKDDGFQTTARSLHSWLTRVLYNKRCKFDPLWTTFVVAGLDQGKPFLGFVDKLGTAYTDPIIATGYASMLATPLIRKAVEDKEKKVTAEIVNMNLSPEDAAKRKKLTLEEGRAVLEESLKLMYYRDARASNKYQIAVIPSSGEVSRIEGPFKLLGDWGVAHLIKGYE